MAVHRARLTRERDSNDSCRVQVPVLPDPFMLQHNSQILQLYNTVCCNTTCYTSTLGSDRKIVILMSNHRLFDIAHLCSSRYFLCPVQVDSDEEEELVTNNARGDNQISEQDSEQSSEQHVQWGDDMESTSNMPGEKVNKLLSDDDFCFQMIVSPECNVWPLSGGLNFWNCMLHKRSQWMLGEAFSKRS